MICTESEAKTKECGNRQPMTDGWGNEYRPLCSGPACMMWEWVDGDTERKEVYWNRGEPEAPPPDGEDWVASDIIEAPGVMRSGCRVYTRPANERRPGTCGLINRCGPC